MKRVPDEKPHPVLPDTEIDDALADIVTEDVETLSMKMLPPGASAAQFPGWLPENIWDIAVQFLRRAEERVYDSYGSCAFAMIKRLIYDPQMEAVWTQLLQKNRTTGGFRLAANLMTVLGRNRADEIHPASTIVVFRDAVRFGEECLQFAEQKRTHYSGQARQLRSDAQSLERALTERRLVNLSPREVHRIAKKFKDAADAYQLLADLVGAGPRPTDKDLFDLDDLFDPDFVVVNNAVPDGVALPGPGLFNKQTLAKYFALNMAATMRGLFDVGPWQTGNSDRDDNSHDQRIVAMYGTVATITRVVLDDNEITGSMVREWCDKEPASTDSSGKEKLVEQLTAWRQNLDGWERDPTPTGKLPALTNFLIITKEVAKNRRATFAVEYRK